jgi:hypothetical protein
MNEARPAFYALAPGGWRDYVTLLHAPYTSGICRTSQSVRRLPTDEVGVLGRTVLALRARGRRPRARRAVAVRSRRGSRCLLGVLAAVSIGAACAIGIVVASRSTWWLLVFVAAGAHRGRVQPRALRWCVSLDILPALAWGAFPILTAYFASAERCASRRSRRAFAVFASLAQRTLSTQVRFARRQAGAASARPAEVALQLLATALPLLAGRSCWPGPAEPLRWGRC